jgi:FkbM family methyltransferase
MQQPQLISRWWSNLRRHPARAVDSSVERTFLGSSYGGYFLNTQLVDASSVVYSFGIGEDVSFDLALISQRGVRVHAFDPTPRAITYARGLAEPKLILHPHGLLDRDGVVAFNPPKNAAHVSHSVLDPSVSDQVTSCGASQFEVRRLRTIVSDLGHSRIDVLKMDVEGAEYAVFDDLARDPIEIGQVLVEFHHGLPGIRVAQTERAIDQLSQLGFRPFAASNTGREWSFVHSSLA